MTSSMIKEKNLAAQEYLKENSTSQSRTSSTWSEKSEMMIPAVSPKKKIMAVRPHESSKAYLMLQPSSTVTSRIATSNSAQQIYPQSRRLAVPKTHRSPWSQTWPLACSNGIPSTTFSLKLSKCIMSTAWATITLKRRQRAMSEEKSIIKRVRKSRMRQMI